MTSPPPSGDRPGAASILEIAEAHYLEILQELEVLKLALRNREDPSEPEIRRITAEFRRATQTLFDERRKVEDVRKRQTGSASGDPIDLDAIRDAIRGRLDRLRAAAAGDELP